MTKRIEWIDTAKGIGIILVIIGHIIPFNNPVCKLIFSFHMPLFFFLSGITYNEKRYTSFKLLLKNKARTLIVPFIITALITIAVNIIIPSWRVNVTWKNIAELLLLWDLHGLNNGPIWFLGCLFSVHILHWCISRVSYNDVCKYVLVCMAAVFGLYINRVLKSDCVTHLTNIRLYVYSKIRLPGLNRWGAAKKI